MNSPPGSLICRAGTFERNQTIMSPPKAVPAKPADALNPPGLLATVSKLWPYLWPHGRRDLQRRVFLAFGLLILAKGVTMGYSGCGLSERLSGTRPTERCPARSRWVRSASRRLQLIRRRSGFCGFTGLVTPICAQPGFVPEMTWWGIWPCYWPPWVCSERVLAGLTLSWPRSWPGWRCSARQL